MVQEVYKGHIALVFFSFFISGTYALGSLAAPYIDPIAFMAMRFVGSVIIIGAYILCAFPKERRRIVQPWRYLILGGIFAVYFVSLFTALKTTTAVATGAMFTLTPFLTAFFAYILLKQTSSAYTLCALAVAAVGAAWVVFRGDLQTLLAFDLGWGEKIFAIGVIAHALYIPLARKLDRGESVILFTFGILAGGSVPLLILGFPGLVATDWTTLPIIMWITLAYIIVFATLITFVLLQYGIQRLPGIKVMAYTYLVPSWIVLWELVLGQGLVAWPVLIGIALTVVPMILLMRR